MMGKMASGMQFNSVHPLPQDEDDVDDTKPDEEQGKLKKTSSGVLEKVRLGTLEGTGVGSRKKKPTLWQRLDPKAFNPEGDWRRSIDWLSLISGVYNTFAVPYLICTQLRSPPVFLLVCSGIADLVLLIHVCISFVTGVPKGPGVEGYGEKFKESAVHYIRKGGFAVDLISSLPCTLAIFGVYKTGGGNPTILVLLDVLQGLKLLRIIRIRKEVKSMYTRNLTSHSTVTLFVSIIVSLLGIHLVACLWLALTRSNGAKGGFMDDCPGPSHIAAAGLSLTKRYRCSLYLVIQVLLSCGSSRVASGSGVEALEAFGAACFILLLAPALHTFRSIARSYSSHRSEYYGRRDAVLAYLRHRNVPEPVCHNAMRHFAFSWEVLQGGADVDDATLCHLPVALRTEALRLMHGSAFSTIPMFLHTGHDNRFWRMMLEGAEVRKYLRGDVIMRTGDVLDSLFVLKSGEVHDMDWSGVMKKIRRRPSSWGEHVWFEVLKGEVKRAKQDMRAASGVEVFVLSRELLRELVSNDGYMKELVARYIDEEGAVAAAEKFKHLWKGLRALSAVEQKKAYKELQMATKQRPGAAGMLR